MAVPEPPPIAEPAVDAPPASVARLAPGEPLAGRYRVIRFIAAGGMGDVYEVEDVTLRDHVALKTIRPEVARDEAAMARFRREIQLARKITHPNVCRTFDIGVHDDTAFLTMELLEGDTLARRLRTSGRMSVEAALPVARQLCAALGAAHKASVVHRDFKAENVMLVPDEDGAERAVVTDFGLALSVGDGRGEESHITGQGVLVGTPATMAPEQLHGGEITTRTDLYSLGVVLFQMVTGKLPFAGGSTQMAAKRLTQDAPRARSLAPELDARWDDAIARCLERDPAARPARADDVLAAIERLAAPGRPRKLSRVAASLAALIGVAVVGAVMIATRDGGDDGDTAAGLDLGAQVTVLVGDFINETGDPELDGLSGLLTTALDQSSRLTVLSHSRVVDLLRDIGKPGDARLDEELGRQVCRHAGVRVLVVSSIRRFDDVYAAEVRVLDVERGTYVFAVNQRAEGKEKIPALIDRLSEVTRAALKESSADIAASTQPVATMTTSNLEAYRYYYEAERAAFSGMNTSRQRELLDRAVAIDPTFALAWWQIAYTEEWEEKGSDRQARAMRAAIENVDRVPAREQLIIRAWDAHLRGDDDAAGALYQRAMVEYEPDKTLYFLAGDLHFHREDHAAALPLFQKALELDPSMVPIIEHAVFSLEVLGRTEEGKALARTATPALQPVLVGRLLAVEGDIDSARDLLERPLAAGESTHARVGRVTNLFVLEMWDQRIDAATRVTAEAEALGLPWFRLVLEFHRGRIGEWQRQLLAWRTPDTALDIDVTIWAARRMLGWREPVPHGDHEEMFRPNGRLLRAVLIEDYPAAIAAARAAGPSHAGEIPVYERLAAGDGDGAIARLSALVSQPIDPDVRRMRLFTLAVIASRAERPVPTLAALDRLRGVYPNGPIGIAIQRPVALHLAGRAHEELGDRAAAARSYRELVSLWRDADQDIPILVDAKARLVRLRVR
ncbi:MAG TPA: serine/threonine-protein kinase [Kofleriaceae bacterium]|nr:serine/threonine-protein kinase [Kofleriaceae bacterium]